MKGKLGVYGTGRIGAGQATLAAGNGFETVVIGHSQRGIDGCRALMLQNWEDMIGQDLAAPENRDAAMALVTITDDPRALAGCEAVFEAVPEERSVKGEAYRQVGRCCAPDTVVASCTSSIPAEELAALIDRPERFLIAHPFQPVHMLPLVEVVRHAGTADWALEHACRLLEQMHRQVVVLRKCVPGFLVNRLAQALFRESIYLIEQGVCTAKDIDRAVKYAMGMRYASIGLLEYFDDVGFDLESEIAKNVYPDLCGTTQLQQTVTEGLARGRTGRAAGQGLYDWGKIDQKDYLLRKQAPYFDGVRQWDMPGKK